MSEDTGWLFEEEEYKPEPKVEQEAPELPPPPETWANPDQDVLFDLPPKRWEKDWKGMPGYEHEDLESLLMVKVHFRSMDDFMQFFQLIEQPPNRRAIWYPKEEMLRMEGTGYVSEDKERAHPRHPVYIISKGRWESRKTARALDAMGVRYSIVVEPQEEEQYAQVIDRSKILVLPFSNLGQGSIPARNWVWEHSVAAGAERHWILDDNIWRFCRYQNNMKVPAKDGAIFRCVEDFVDRYDNVGLAGMQYEMFVVRKRVRWPPLVWNTRIYSCILIRNDLPFRWRGRYNEDTDLSLRVLKSGVATVLFNAFLAAKMATMTMKGGNTDELYKDDGRLLMAQSLVDQHPDVVKVSRKWGRAQHHVNYIPFKRNDPRLKADAVIPAESDEYGMVWRPPTLKEIEEERKEQDGQPQP